MMDAGVKVRNQLEHLLTQELECFSEILVETESFLSQFDTYSLESIIDLLNMRQRKIDFIKQLESELKSIKVMPRDVNIKSLQNNITELAQTLVVIDARILDILQTVKAQYLNAMSGLVNRQQKVGQIPSTQGNKPQIVDIIQE